MKKVCNGYMPALLKSRYKAVTKPLQSRYIGGTKAVHNRRCLDKNIF
jgi:hypothetical protein